MWNFSIVATYANLQSRTREFPIDNSWNDRSFLLTCTREHFERCKHYPRGRPAEDSHIRQTTIMEITRRFDVPTTRHVHRLISCWWQLTCEYDTLSSSYLTSVPGWCLDIIVLTVCVDYVCHIVYVEIIYSRRLDVTWIDKWNIANSSYIIAWIFKMFIYNFEYSVQIYDSIIVPIRSYLSKMNLYSSLLLFDLNKII